MNTYHLEQAAHQWMALLDILQEEYPEFGLADLRDTLEGETDLRECIAMIIRAQREDKARVESLKLIIADMQARKKRFEERIAAMNEAVCQAMVKAELKKIEEPDFTVSVRKGTPKVVIVDEGAVPLPYWKPQPPKLDLAAIKDALKDGPIDGATLSNAGPTITVRTK
jgi:hypothetical protein